MGVVVHRLISAGQVGPSVRVVGIYLQPLQVQGNGSRQVTGSMLLNGLVHRTLRFENGGIVDELLVVLVLGI